MRRDTNEILQTGRAGVAFHPPTPEENREHDRERLLRVEAYARRADARERAGGRGSLFDPPLTPAEVWGGAGPTARAA